MFLCTANATLCWLILHQAFLVLALSLVALDVCALQAKFPPRRAQSQHANDVVPDTATTVYFIRHGKSVSNEWMLSAPENNWGAPDYNDYNGNVRDAPLSEKGIQQAQRLSKKLRSMTEESSWLHQVELIVLSPMTRCLETFLHGVAPVAASSIPIVVAPLLTERVYSMSETGRPKAALQADFPQKTLDWSACEEDAWWYIGSPDDLEWRPTPATYAVPGEPEDVFTKRMEVLRSWLRSRPERCILAVAHWGVINYFTEHQEIENCQVVPVQIEH